MVEPYDSAWPRRFTAERRVLEAALAPWLDGEIEHIGSTAVPGLAAKPVIDMIAPVRELEASRGAFDLLAALGYGYREHRPEAHAFAKPAGAPWWEATHGLHLTERGSDIWRERLAFRDALRADAGLAAEYQAWKERHATAVGAEGPYDARKFDFVSRVLAAAGIELRPDRERLSRAVPAARTAGRAADSPRSR
jgi:GrpB-like predicted nucleotidyltransferase (UPF0157 family)